MLDYFKYLYKYFEVGAPVYFVTKRGYDFTTVEGMDGICSSVGCDQFSLTQKIQYATNYADKWVGGERNFLCILIIFTDTSLNLGSSLNLVSTYDILANQMS